MQKLAALWMVVALTPPLLGQTLSMAPPHVEGRYVLGTVTKYCRALETLSSLNQPRLFAEVYWPSGGSSHWVEYSGESEWESAGKPRPLALVWYRDDHVARVLIASKDGDNPQRFAEYCYRADGTLARIRSIPEVWKDCDKSHLRCHFTFAEEGLYLPSGRAIKGPSEAIQSSFLAGLANSETTGRNSGDFDLRPLKSEETSVSFAEFPIEYLSVRALPFNQLLSSSAK
jgi:hypothetical protein